MTDAPWAAETIELRPVASLIAYARNARTHSDKQLKLLADAIQRFGFVSPVLIKADGTIGAGHGRVRAAALLGLDKVPTITAPSHWTEADFKAYVLADNKIAEQAGWDSSLLKLELLDLKSLDFDLSLTGFSTVDISAILAPAPGEGLTDPDDIPVEEEQVVSEPGDLWHLDAHRIICGSSTEKVVIEALLQGARPHLMVTDPPYGTNYDPEWRGKVRNADGTRLSTGMDRAVGVVLNDHQADWTDAYRHFISAGGEVAYVWHAPQQTHVVAQGLIDVGLELRTQIVWAKSHFVVSRAHYHPGHEPCWYAVKKGAKGHWQGGRKQQTVWTMEKPRKSETGHSTQKPIDAMRRPIENNSLPGDAVFEPFSGSGTTLIAAEMTGRVSYSVELNPAYVDIAVRRWQAYTGKEATLASTGETYSQVKARRG